MLSTVLIYSEEESLINWW